MEFILIFAFFVGLSSGQDPAGAAHSDFVMQCTKDSIDGAGATPIERWEGWDDGWRGAAFDGLAQPMHRVTMRRFCTCLERASDHLPREVDREIYLWAINDLINGNAESHDKAHVAIKIELARAFGSDEAASSQFADAFSNRHIDCLIDQLERSHATSFLYGTNHLIAAYLGLLR